MEIDIMIYSNTIQRLMFDYDSIEKEEIIEICKSIPPKIIRWMGTNHPDNQLRKIFFEITNIEIGEGSVINIGFVVSDGYHPLLKIGKRVAISPNVTIICESNPNNSLLLINPYVKDHLDVTKPVHVHDDVWIGANAVILPGVTIGERAIIGAGCVVNKNVASKTIVAGIPNRVIRKLMFDKENCK